MNRYIKLYTIYTEDGGYWLDPSNPFITEAKVYAGAVLKLYLQHTGKEHWAGTEKAKIVNLDIEERVFNGQDERIIPQNTDGIE